MLKADELYQLLHAAYGSPRWWSDDAFTVMFQAVLVQNTAWRSVEKVCAGLGDTLAPEYIVSVTIEELEAIIRPCGFYKAKARTIKALAAWFGQYHYERQTIQQMPISKLREELLSIRGVGAETADVILVYAFYKPSFIIDAYTRRFLARLGYSFLDDVAVRQFFEAALPKDAELYGWYHWLILTHCLSACKKDPQCHHCPLKAHCKQGC